MIWAVLSGGKATEGSAVVGLDDGNLDYPAKSFAVRRIRRVITERYSRDREVTQNSNWM